MQISLLSLSENQSIEYIYEKPEKRNWLTCLYVHGFKSSGTSGTKSSQTKYAMLDNNIAFLWWNFRGNNLDHDDTMDYQTMNFDTMADDTIAMLEYAIEQWAQKNSILIMPSSLWSTATIQALMKRPDLHEYIAHIYFIAPCINFGEYKTTQAIAKWELTEDELQQRKQQWWREELHFRKQKNVRVGWELIQNWIDEQQNMIHFVHGRSIPTTIFHWDQDDQIYPENGRALAWNVHDYNEVIWADHQFSAHYNDVLVHVMKEVFSGQ